MKYTQNSAPSLTEKSASTISASTKMTLDSQNINTIHEKFLKEAERLRLKKENPSPANVSNLEKKVFATPSMRDEETEKNIQSEMNELKLSPRFTAFKLFLNEHTEESWANSYWRELCLMSEIDGSELEADKLYLTVKEGEIRYKTNLMSTDLFVKLEGNISERNGELYKALEKNNLSELSESCKNRVLYIAAKRRHIDSKSKFDKMNSSDLDKIKEKNEFKEKEIKTTYSDEFKLFKKITTALEEIISRQKFDDLLGEVSKDLDLDKPDLGDLINRSTFIVDTDQQEPPVKSVRNIEDKTPVCDLKEKKNKTADQFFREKILDELKEIFGFDDIPLFVEFMCNYHANNKNKAIIAKLKKCREWSDIDTHLAESILNLAVNFDPEKMNRLRYIAEKENNKKAKDFLLKQVIFQLQNIFGNSDFNLFKEIVVNCYMNNQNKQILDQLSTCTEWTHIDVELAESILNLAFNFNAKKNSRFYEILSGEKNNKALREKILEELQETFNISDIHLFKEIIFNYYANDENKESIDRLMGCKEWDEIDVDLAKKILKLALNDNSEKISLYEKNDEINGSVNVEETGSEDVRIVCIDELYKTFGANNIELFKEMVLNWHINDKNREGNNISTLKNCKDWSDINYSLAEYLLSITQAENINSSDGDLGKKYGKKYKKIMEEYERIYKNYNGEDIWLYAKQVREKKSGKKYDEISAMALIMQASQIAVGYGLRKIQILAMLEFLDGDTNKFCQINTGEGKTTITAALAVLKVLQGEQVDIITSNPVLAEDAIQEKKDFYALFGVSVSHNNPDITQPYFKGKKPCYDYDVVYGTLGAFAFDYLHNNVEALETKVLFYKDGHPVERQYATVIIDEADNVILDNYALITSQAKSISGLDCIKFIYFDIWQDLITQEAELRLDEKDITDESKAALNDKIDRQKLAIKIKNDVQIPSFIKQIMIQKIDLLIENAIKARYDLHLDEDYLINKVEDEDNVLPLEKEIGVRLKNFTWTDLHPFIQIKHNLSVNSSASITSVFIPNFVYLAKYNKIYGLTGTLGSQQEQDLIYKVYKAKSTIIPPFKSKARQKIDLLVIETESVWLDSIKEVAEKYISNRAVLFVCDTPKSLKKVQRKLQESGFHNITTYEHEGDAFKIDEINKGTRCDLCLMSDIGEEGPEPGKIYLTVEGNSVKYRTHLTPANDCIPLEGEISKTNSELYKAIKDNNLKQISQSCKEALLGLTSKKKHTQEKGLGKGQIIISTNIGGRGTDIKLDDDLRKSGGLHEVTTYLPKNKRTEMQAAGRAGRSGDPGSSQIICQQSEVDSLIKIVQRNKNDEELSSKKADPLDLRDGVEKMRLQDAEIQLRIILDRYTWFEKFQSIYYELKKKETVSYFILEDIKLEFGLLYQKEIKSELSVFLDKLKNYANADSPKYKFINPYYALNYAQNLLREGSHDEAREVLNVKNNIRIEEIEKGGDSFYRAIENQLQELKIVAPNNQHYTSNDLRKLAINYLRKNKTTSFAKELKMRLSSNELFLHPDLPNNIESIDDYLEYHQKEEAKTDSGMVVSLARALAITIKILSADTHDIFYINPGRDDKRTANLGYSENHYDSIVISAPGVELENLLFYRELTMLPAYHLTLFEIEIHNNANLLYKIVGGTKLIDFGLIPSSSKKMDGEENSSTDYLNKAKEILQTNLKDISDFINSSSFQNICLTKEAQVYNFGDNMMKKHLESEQSLMIITLSHIESLLQLLKKDTNKKLALKKTYTFDDIIKNGIDVGLPIEDLLATEITLAFSLGLGVYYEVEALVDLSYSDKAVLEASLKIFKGTALLLTTYIPSVGLCTKPLVGVASKLIITGSKKMLSLIFNDPDIDDEDQSFFSYLQSVAVSSGNPIVAITKALITVITQVTQNFIAKCLVKNSEKNDELMNKIKKYLLNPVKTLIREPLKKIDAWRKEIFDSIKNFLFDPLRTLKKSLLNYLTENASLMIEKTGSSNTDMETCIDDLSLIIDGITSLKVQILNVWKNGVDIFNQIKDLSELKNSFKTIKRALIKKDIMSLIDLVGNLLPFVEKISTQVNRLGEEINSLVNKIFQDIPLLVKNIYMSFERLRKKILTLSEGNVADLAAFFISLVVRGMSQFRVISDVSHYVQEMFDRFFSKIEGIVDTILQNNPIDNFLKKYGIDFFNIDHTIENIVSYALNTVLKFIKSLFFKSSTIEEKNKNNSDSQPVAAIDSNPMPAKTNQCVTFALLNLLNVDEKQLLSVTRSYLSGKMTKDEGLTKWQTKFILEDLGLKVAETSTNQKQDYRTIAYNFLIKNASECGGLSLVTAADQPGHAFYIKNDGSTTLFIDEKSSPSGVDDLTIYNKNYFLVPMNFTLQKRIEIKNKISTGRSTNIWMNFKFIIRCILEVFFENEKFGARPEDVDVIADHACQQICDLRLDFDSSKAREIGVHNDEIDFVKNKILGKLDMNKEDWFRAAWTGGIQAALDEAFATSIMRTIYLKISKKKEEQKRNFFEEDSVVGFFALASHFRLPTEMTGFNLTSDSDSFYHVDLPNQVNPIFQHPTNRNALYVYPGNPNHHSLDKKRVEVATAVIKNESQQVNPKNILYAVHAAANYTVNYMVAPPLAENNKVLISDEQKLVMFNQKREEFKMKVDSLADFLYGKESNQPQQQSITAKWRTPGTLFNPKGRCSPPRKATMDKGPSLGEKRFLFTGSEARSNETSKKIPKKAA